MKNRLSDTAGHGGASPLLDVAEAAAFLNVSPATVRRFRRDGVLPVVKLGGQNKSRIRFRREDLHRLIESGYTPATSGPLAR